MSYQEELKKHYKEVRKRLYQNAKPEKAPAISLPQPTPKRVEEELPKAVKAEEPPKSPGLSTPETERELICKALRITNLDDLEKNTQLYRMADELINAPRLPPLPGLVLNEKGAIRWMRILHAVAAQHGVQASEILSESRRRIIVNARFEVFYRLRMDLAMSYIKIGTVMRKDHTTVMHGVSQIRKRLLDENNRLADYGVPALVLHSDQTGTHTNLSAA